MMVEVRIELDAKISYPICFFSYTQGRIYRFKEEWNLLVKHSKKLAILNTGLVSGCRWVEAYNNYSPSEAIQS